MILAITFFFYRTTTVWVPIIFIALLVIAVVLSVLSGLYAGGMISSETFAGLVIATLILFAVIGAVGGVVFFYLRVIRRL
jgi:hypothetical protein